MTSREVYQRFIECGGEINAGDYVLPIDFLNECLPYAGGSVENLEAMIESGMATEAAKES